MIPLFKVHMPESVMEPLRATLMSGYIGQGPRVEQFEHALVRWVGSRQVLTVNSGTSAIHLALRLAGVGRGDEVISSPMTCTATNEPILERGAKIVWADVDPHTGNIDPRDVERKITARTKAVVAVHWGGYPCDLDELNDIGRRHGVRIIEDAAHAFGAEYRGWPIGSHSDFVCFSFQAIKHLTTVDGGCLVCKDPLDDRRGKLLRWYGIDRECDRKDFRCEEDILEHGYKFHMNDVAATIGMEQLKWVGLVLEKHRTNAAFFRNCLESLPGLGLLHYRPDRVSSYWLFTVLVDDRPRFMEEMKQAGIMVSQVHARNDKHTMCRDFVRPLPGLDEFAAHQVSVPVGWWLSEEDREHIVRSIQSFCRTGLRVGVNPVHVRAW
ncbi:MAG: DegT/DnrJ/EryC1/StrS family aminotransferase [Gammaproteobacteria bacterium]